MTSSSHPESPSNPVAPDHAPPGMTSRGLSLAGLATLLGMAALLRFKCSLGEVWLDEVWTWEISRKLTWIGGLFYQLREENNHYLNTLFVWLLRDQPGWLFRLPSVVCGVMTVRVAWSLGATQFKYGDQVRWLAGGLTATSYLMVHYSSESRGYSYAVFFAALAFHQLQVLEACRQRGSDITPRGENIQLTFSWLFALACCGGFLSQPIFLTCFGAMGIWVYLRLSKPGREDQVWPTLMRYFLSPGLFFVALYLIDLRHAVNGGGDQYPLWRVVLETLSLAGGGPFAGGGAAVVAVLVAATFVHGLRVLARGGDDRWKFYLVVVVLLPLALLVVLRRAEVYPRYFLIAVFFLIQVVSVGIVDLFQRGAIGGIAVMIGLTAAMWGNGQHIGRLTDLGRGGYLPILESIPFQDSSPVIQLRSDHDFRHLLMLKYFWPLAKMQGRALDYVEVEQVPPEGTEWLLTHSLDVTWQPPRTRSVRGVVYDLRLVRPYAGLSGWGLALYQRRATATLPKVGP